MSSREESVRLKALSQWVAAQVPLLAEYRAVLGVGVAHRADRQDGPLCVRVIVERAVGRAVPGWLSGPIDPGDGEATEVEVVDAVRYVGEALPAQPDDRTRYFDPLRPGCSLSGAAGEKGTVGAIVYHRESSHALALSCWHVLSRGASGPRPPTYQPGRYEREHARRRLGSVHRSFMGPAGDVAVSTIPDREVAPEMLGLAVAPLRTESARLLEPVVKSGASTGVTTGLVTIVSYRARMRDRADDIWVEGFVITPDPARPPRDGELSAPGDSGALWMQLGADGRATNAAVGLHMAGELALNVEYAVACDAGAAMAAVDVSFDSSVRAQESVWDDALHARSGRPGDIWDERSPGRESLGEEATQPADPDSLGLAEPSTAPGGGLAPGLAVAVAMTVFASLCIAADVRSGVWGFPELAEYKLLSSLVTMTILAGVAERTSDLILSLLRQPDRDMRRQRIQWRLEYVEQIRRWLAEDIDSAERTHWTAVLNDQFRCLILERKQLGATRRQTRAAALALNALIGLAATCAGIYALAPVLAAAAPSLTFRVLDTLFTAALVAAGGEGIHRLVSALKRSMEVRRLAVDPRAMATTRRR